MAFRRGAALSIAAALRTTPPAAAGFMSVAATSGMTRVGVAHGLPLAMTRGFVSSSSASFKTSSFASRANGGGGGAQQPQLAWMTSRVKELRDA
eukprot:CAMPEP_0197598968 /NCGR_PEP_ID=MMETSP1326-20131121/30405_1 /TAXON_ID=1155430 /ORGANISM="Genus nov. species nov., Strain RCC2288" /LENGTH=93 /DNA_ID=CAMNT_0043165851 /DNA_START=128 /DNA_END=405 /DNA_ORIENTATION=+